MLSVLAELRLLAGRSADSPSLLEDFHRLEIGVMVQQCLDRRIPEKATLVAEIAAWESRRNAEQAGINWVFTVDRAREKLARVYPQPACRVTVAA